MKRCPECRRDYYDDSLVYCLEDGSPLIQGSVPSPDEPQTAILHETVAPNEAATRAQMHTTGQTAVLPTGTADVAGRRHFDRRILLAPAALILIVLAGLSGYRYFSASAQIGSIAVMPFVNETGNADVEYLSDGMTETLIKGLSNIPNLSVKPRSTVFRYKGKDADLKMIARELNVQAILNGRVTQRGDQLTLSLELIDIPDDKVIWSEQYQRGQSEIVSLQSEIARDVSTRIKSKLTGIEEQKVTSTGTSDPEAYQAYLKGRYLWNRRTAVNINSALEQFRIATERDPNYALAFVGLADCYLVLNEYAGVPTQESLPKAKAHAERALALDNGLGEAHATLGLIAQYSWDWTESEKQFKRAIEINPNYATAYHWYSIRLRQMGRYDESVPIIMRAQELDPVSSVIAVNVARTYHLLDKDQGAVEVLRKLVESDPAFPSAHQYLALIYLDDGRYAEAVASAEKAVELANRNGISLGDLGFVYGSAGKEDQARAVLVELESKYTRRQADGTNLATVYVALGEKDKAFEWLEKAFSERSSQMPNIGWIAQFTSLRDDPRFRNLLRRMNLPE